MRTVDDLPVDGAGSVDVPTEFVLIDNVTTMLSWGNLNWSDRAPEQAPLMMVTFEGNRLDGTRAAPATVVYHAGKTPQLIGQLVQGLVRAYVEAPPVSELADLLPAPDMVEDSFLILLDCAHWIQLPADAQGTTHCPRCDKDRKVKACITNWDIAEPRD